MFLERKFLPITFKYYKLSEFEEILKEISPNTQPQILKAILRDFFWEQKKSYLLAEKLMNDL